MIYRIKRAYSLEVILEMSNQYTQLISPFFFVLVNHGLTLFIVMGVTLMLMLLVSISLTVHRL